MPFSDAQLLPISALQHLLFCERQAALIHVEQLWAENRFTVEGAQLHKKAHGGKAEHRAAPGVHVQRGVQLASYQLGLFGVADVIEFRRDSPPVLIEYKRGRPKKHDADKVQLCAQALCLEEMLGLSKESPGDAVSEGIRAGAIFYGQTRRRMDVPFDDALRSKTRAAAARLHEMIAKGETPQARREKKCDRCSLLNLCLPDAMKPRATAGRYLDQALDAVLVAHP